MKIRYIIPALAAVLLLTAACSPVKTITPLAPVVGPAGTIAPGSPSSQPLLRANSPTNAPVQPPGATSGQNQPSNNGPVSLQVLSPQNEAVVNTSQIEVSGTASPGAVVSVNDDITTAGADGRFTAGISLDEGPNLIEIIASNNSGSELSAEITVTYEP